jgi:tRNA(Ile2) C34 agmatinyltransferase TiaS
VLIGSSMIAETGSSIEFKCRKCGRFIQLRSSREIPAEGGAPGSAKKGG